MIKEFWLPVRGWEGLYAASDLGRVRSLPRVVDRCGSKLPVRGRILRAGLTRDGYFLVALCRGVRPCSMHVHRVVAEAFLSERPERADVDHADGDRKNNVPYNLRWATRSQNNANGKYGAGASRFRGVTMSDAGTWIAQVRHKGKHIHIGTFSTEEEAARAFDAKLLDLHGDFARLNFPEEAR